MWRKVGSHNQVKPVAWTIQFFTSSSMIAIKENTLDPLKLLSQVLLHWKSNITLNCNAYSSMTYVLVTCLLFLYFKTRINFQSWMCNFRISCPKQKQNRKCSKAKKPLKKAFTFNKQLYVNFIYFRKKNLF